MLLQRVATLLVGWGVKGGRDGSVVGCGGHLVALVFLSGFEYNYLLNFRLKRG